MCSVFRILRLNKKKKTDINIALKMLLQSSLKTMACNRHLKISILKKLKKKLEDTQ